MFEYVFRSEINVRNFPISVSRFFICFSVLFLSHGLSLNLEFTDQLDRLLSP